MQAMPMLGSIKTLLARTFVPYALAVVVIGISLLLQSFLVYQLGLNLPTFIVLYPGIMLVAILAGFRAGLLATVLAVLMANYIFQRPFGHFAVANLSDAVSLFIFAAMGVFVSLLAEHDRRSTLREQAHASQRRQAEMMHGAFDAIMVLRLNGSVESWNRGAERLYGYAESQALGGDPHQLLKTSPAIPWPEIVATLRKQNPWERELHQTTKDGRAVIVATRYQLMSGPDGVERILKIGRDISERKQAENDLAVYQEKLTAALSSMADAVFISDTDGNLIHFNDAFATFHKFRSKEECSRRVADFQSFLELRNPDGTLVPLDMWSVPRALRGETGANVEYSLRRKDTGEAWIGSYSFGPIRDSQGAIAGAAVVGRDITGRKRAEEHIRQLNRVYAVLSDINQTIVREKSSEAMLHAACRIAIEKGGFRMAWIGMIDPDTQALRPVASSGAVNGYLDHLMATYPGRANNDAPTARCLHSGEHAICNDIEHDPAYEAFREAALGRGFRSSGCFPLKVDDQVAGVLNLYSGEPGFFEEDELKLLDEMTMDIGFALEVNRREAQRQKAEAELRWRTAFFEAGVDSSMDGMLVVDSEGKKLLQNRRMNELLKIPPQVSEDPDDAQQIRYVSQLMKHPDEFVAKVNYLNSHPEEISRDEVELLDGTILDRYSSPVKDKAQNYYGRIWTFRDITEQRHLEEQYRQAQKMEAIGQLTGGIAHDFNNLLTVVLGCSEVIREEVWNNARLSKMADMIQTAGRRGTDLTHRMLAFARRQTLQPRPVDIRQLLTEMESFLQHTLSADIALDIVHSKEACIAVVDQAQLENALLNLCLNAQDAMPRGGCLTIESGHAVLDAAYAEHHAEVTPGEYILIAVSDTGCGIPPENLQRVFDPFFTTKEVGKGTGLGLSMVYGFVKQSQGHIKIYSEPGHGTSVKLYLPHSPQAGETASHPQLSAADARGSETILLVEDDDVVREYARIQLEDLGYHVLEATNGHDALQLVTTRGDIDLLFTDMVMPGRLNGYELAQEACKLNPQIKVLYCSGYAENAMLHQGLLDKDAMMLHKPYTRQELSRRMREALAKRPRTSKADAP